MKRLGEPGPRIGEKGVETGEGPAPRDGGTADASGHRWRGCVSGLSRCREIPPEAGGTAIA